MSDTASQPSQITVPASVSKANSVVVEQRGGGWFVRIVEGSQVYENVFHLEAHASSYADGQRMRLGLFR